MLLNHTRGGTELAYFSDNTLYVTWPEAVNHIFIGTLSNGYLHVVTSTICVGFKWRN